MWPPIQKICDEKSLLRDARDYALNHGLVIRQNNISNNNIVVHYPITLFPCPFPRRLYQLAELIQKDVNQLMYKVATNIEFMSQSLQSVIDVDDFTKNIYNINVKIEKAGRSQPYISCISRSDYMLNAGHFSSTSVENKLNLRQVEVNAIASSLSGPSKHVSELHKYIISKHKVLSSDPFDTESILESNTPQNGGHQLVCDGLIRAFDAYDKINTYILVVCEERTLNFSDHRLTEEGVYRIRPDIHMLRRRFVDLSTCTRLGPNQELLVDEKEIAVVYFRCCYDPSHYNFDNAWNLRLLLEKSRAIKCPSSNFHLSGVKKFQQVINDEKSLEKFVAPQAAKRLSQVFSSFWPLGFDEKGNQALNMALRKPQNLVLKPQREGGGHNIYKEAIVPFLTGIKDSPTRNQYILMEYIDSPTAANWILLHDQSDETFSLKRPEHLVSELGIYGSVLAGTSGMETNNSSGYLVRSKKLGVNEGGVLSGYAALSSLYLLNESDEAYLNNYYKL